MLFLYILKKKLKPSELSKNKPIKYIYVKKNIKLIKIYIFLFIPL